METPDSISWAVSVSRLFLSSAAPRQISSILRRANTPYRGVNKEGRKSRFKTEHTLPSCTCTRMLRPLAGDQAPYRTWSVVRTRLSAQKHGFGSISAAPVTASAFQHQHQQRRSAAKGKGRGPHWRRRFPWSSNLTPSRPFPIIFTPLPALDGKVRISNLRLTPRPEPRYDRPPKLASSDAKASAIQYRGFAGQGPTRTHLNLLFFWGRAKGLVRAASHLNKTDFGPLPIGQAARGVRSRLRTGQALG